MTYLFIVAGAVLGAPLRYFLGVRIQSATGSSFPWGTFTINVTGCLLIGILLGFAERHEWPGREARLFLVTGFLGSYTTFSAFGFEAYTLLRGDEVLRALAYAIASVVFGVGAAWAGVSIGRAGG